MDKVIFLDRDGVINKCPPPHSHIKRTQDLILLPKVKEAIHLCKQHGYKIIIITNQRTVPTWLCENLNKYLLKLIPEIDKIYYCNHDYNSCECRKPKIGLFLQAEQDFQIDKSKSYMIGDSVTDIQAGNNYGVKSLLTTNLYQTIKEIL